MHTPPQQQPKLTSQQIHEWRDELFVGQSLRHTARVLEHWPLRAYLWAAVFQAEMLSKIKKSGGVWQTPAWDFGRFAKAHPQLLHLDSAEALRLVKETIGCGFWKEHLGMGLADAEMAFDHVWTECRAIPGYDPLALAVVEAQKDPAQDSSNGPTGYRMFLNVARSLHHRVDAGRFMLPCERLAALLGCEPMTVSRYRQKAIRDGFLRVAKEHTYRSGRGEATEFVFLAS